MAKRTLETVLAVRRSSVNDARAAMASAIVNEAAAAADESQIATTIQAELDAASAPDADDAAVEAIGSWLPQARLRQATARDRRQTAESMTARARAALAAALTAEEAVRSMIAAENTRTRADNERRAQAALDELAHARSHRDEPSVSRQDDESRLE